MKKKRTTKSIKLDRAKVSKQKHEIAYIKKKAKELEKLCQKELELFGNKVVVDFGELDKQFTGFPLSTIKRICVAVRKYL